MLAFGEVMAVCGRGRATPAGPHAPDLRRGGPSPCARGPPGRGRCAAGLHRDPSVAGRRPALAAAAAPRLMAAEVISSGAPARIARCAHPRKLKICQIVVTTNKRNRALRQLARHSHAFVS